MDSSTGRFFRLIISILILVVAGWLIVSLSSTITILIIAALIAYILDPLASYFEARGLSRAQATIIIFIAIAAITAAFFSFLLPPFISELHTIEKGLSSGASNQFFNNMEDWVVKQIPIVTKENLDFQHRLSEMVRGLSNSFFAILGSVVSIVTTLVIIPFAVFFLLKDGPHMKKELVSMIPNRHFERVLNLIYKTDLQLGGYLRGQFFDALIIGLLSTIALLILDVPYFILIGMFAGMANMIPYVGPLTGAVAAILIVVLNGGSGNIILLVALAFIVIQLLDNVLVQPLVVAKSVDLHPLLIIFAVIIGGQFFGILGMLLAVPATGMIKVLITEFYSSTRSYNMI